VVEFCQEVYLLKGVFAILAILLIFSCSGSGSLAKTDAKKDIPVSSDVDFGPYMLKLQREIMLNWHPAKSTLSKKTVVSFEVNSDGCIDHVFLFKSSGDASRDQAVLRAVQKLGSLDPLPPGAIKKIKFHYQFNSCDFDGRPSAIMIDW
jgi:TonB family protein